MPSLPDDCSQMFHHDGSPDLKEGWYVPAALLAGIRQLLTCDDPPDLVLVPEEVYQRVLRDGLAPGCSLPEDETRVRLLTPRGEEP